MFTRDLENWDYIDIDDVPCYISGSDRLVIFKDFYESEDQGRPQWFWRVYDEGIGDLAGEDLLTDDTYDHELGPFNNPQEAYADIIEQGMNRS